MQEPGFVLPSLPNLKSMPISRHDFLQAARLGKSIYPVKYIEMSELCAADVRKAS